MRFNLPIDKDLEQILDSEEVSQFLKAVDSFISLHRTEKIDIKSFVNQSCNSLIELYYRSRFLPKIQRKYSTIGDSFPKSLEWGYAHTIDLLENLMKYFTINPYPANDSNLSPSIDKRSLGDDLSSIFFDVVLCQCLLAEGTSKSVEGALISYKLRFDSHLGISCLKVINVLNYMRFWKPPNKKVIPIDTTLKVNLYHPHVNLN